jgi:16S rRNA U1498 N3-methylase RsmE
VNYSGRVNLLLVEPSELSAEGAITLADERAQHLRTVLGTKIGQVVRAGIVGGPIGEATVLADDGAQFTLQFRALRPPAPQLPVDLVLALPRPKVLTRVIEACAAFAVRRVDLTNAWRVDKSYLGSPRLAPEALARAVRLGASQGATTHLPELHIHDRLMALLDQRFAALEGLLELRFAALDGLLDLRFAALGGPLDQRFAAPEGVRLIAHPGAPPIEQVVMTAAPATIAIGPEGGWIGREVETFVARGFQPVSLAGAILRVETAVATALGQLALLHRMRHASPSS